MPNHGKSQRLLDALPDSAKELAERLGIEDSWARRVLAAAHKAKKIHIVAWRRRVNTSGDLAPIFARGAGPDNPRPTKEPYNDVRRRYRAKRVAVAAREASRAAVRALIAAQAQQGHEAQPDVPQEGQAGHAALG